MRTDVEEGREKHYAIMLTILLSGILDERVDCPEEAEGLIHERTKGQTDRRTGVQSD